MKNIYFSGIFIKSLDKTAFDWYNIITIGVEMTRAFYNIAKNKKYSKYCGELFIPPLRFFVYIKFYCYPDIF